ncbi:effector-associated domain 2-containing protein [Amycolatopsis sp. NBC_00438]|uniref:effector-associated domain 2-containing protein n=1 Tax=Amycolatopsis sp. NBC_00438 TaxID=2903558 RepID=UPI002E1EE2BC
MHSYPAALHRTIMVVDIAGYNDPKRTVAHLHEVHEGLWGVLRRTLAETGVSWEACLIENTGDGAMFLLPPDMAKADLVTQLPERMLGELRRHNAVHTVEARLQLRLAIHAGEVHRGSHGSISPAVNYTFRLLDAKVAKVAQKQTGAQLAIIVSEEFYREVVKHDPAADSDAYRQILAEVKETTAQPWLRLLGGTPGNDLSVPPPAPHRILPRPQSSLPELIEALLAIPCVRDGQSRRLLLEVFRRREIAEIVPYHAEDRLHVIALARTCQRFDGGMSDLLDAVRTIEPESPQVEALALIIEAWPDPRIR